MSLRTAMDTTEHPSDDKAPRIRTSQACQRCRSLKTRCLPSEQSGTCQRCFTSKRDCVWPEAQRRAKRLRGPSRISQVEQKIDGLVASLVHPETARPVPTPSEASPDAERQPTQPTQPTAQRRSWQCPKERPVAPGSWMQDQSLSLFDSGVPTTPHNEVDADVDADRNFHEDLRKIHNFGDSEVRHPPNFSATAAPTEPPIDNDIVKKMLANGEADELLNEYRSMAVSLPFVPIADTASAEDLSVRKPMMFLAILTIASWRTHQRQLALDRLYRTELATRTIIRPRRTLSLIQSVIVYLSWYHFVFSHRTQQIFPLLHLAIGLAMDLSLHIKARRPFSDVVVRPKLPSKTPLEEREAQRTFLGCYYLSSAIANGMQKPHSLKWSDYMNDCGRRLREDREYPTDEVLLDLIALRQIDDQIHDELFANDHADLPVTNTHTMMHLHSIEAQVKHWKTSCRTTGFESVLDLPHAFTKMQLYSVGLRPAHSAEEAPTASPTQLNAMIATLDAGKSFLDTLLATPVAEYHLIAFPEWMRLPWVVMTMAKLCIPSDAHNVAQWDVKLAQDRLRLDLCLESLCYRMKSLSTYEKRKQPHPDFWHAMEMIMDSTRIWFCRKIRPRKISVSATPTLPTPDTTHSSHASAVPPFGGYLATPATDTMADFSTELLDLNEPQHENANDPFAFMWHADFDMDQFMNMGLWGYESYESLGFGGGANRP